MRALLLFLGLLLSGGAAAQDVPPYRDADRPTHERVADLLSRMTLDEKIGQMTQIDVSRLMGDGEWDRGPLNPAWLEAVLGDASVGSLLSGGNAAPVPDDPAGWFAATEALQRFALERSRLGIPILYGVDAVHGHAHVRGATVYPHQIGLAATFDEDLLRRVGRAVGEDVAATGVTWNFAPVADLGRDPRWGRFYETFGENAAVVGALTEAYVEGQREVPRLAVTLKHFVGYGAAESGNDRAPADLSLRTLHGAHLPPFAAGLRAGARTIMIDSGSVAGVPVHASRYLLTEVLRGELGFDGVALSDWADVDKLVGVHRVARDATSAAAMAVNAGVDVVMVPHDAEGFTAALEGAVRSGLVPAARIDEAVGRVLSLKFELGLFDAPFADPAAPAGVVEEDRALARRAALESVTLLENRGDVLPLTDVRRVLVTGPGATDVAMQMGGWTLGWQGLTPGSGAPPAVTVLDGLRGGAPAGVEVRHVRADAGDLVAAAVESDAIVVVVGEPPYAEGLGDDDDLTLPADALSVVRALEDGLASRDVPVILVILAGRPLLLPDELLDGADAIVMAYLPGSEAGSALADIVYGRASPSGRLPFTWPASVGQLPITSEEAPAEAGDEPLYPLGHGRSYTRFEYSDAAAERIGDRLRLSVTVENVGERPGDEAILAWAEFPVLPVLTPERLLVGFGRTTLEPGESRRVDVEVPLERLAIVPGDVPGRAEPIVATGDYRFRIGTEWTDAFLPTCHVEPEGTATCP